MKNVLKEVNLSFISLLSSIIYSGYVGPNAFNVAIISVLSVLYGWKIWLDHVKKPDYNYDLHEKFKSLEEELSKTQDAFKDIDAANQDQLKAISENIEQRIDALQQNVTMVKMGQAAVSKSKPGNSYGTWGK